MSFWNLSDNSAVDTNGEFETGGGNIEPIPANTDVLAVCDEAKWDDFNGDRYISLRWTVMKPADYKNRKVFQKVRVMDDNASKADKAKRMLAAIDANAGGKLVAAGEEPTDENLTKCLTNKPMVLRLQVWEIETEQGEKKTGNWVSAVSPRQGVGSAPQQPEPATAQEPAGGDDMEDDVPF